MTRRAPALAAYAGPALHDGQPHEGHFVTRLVKGGPEVPARIWRPCHCTINGGDDNRVHDWRDSCDRFPALACEVDGRPVDPLEAWTWLAKQPIGRAEFEFMTADAEWCRQHAPDDPKASPRQKVDWNAINISF